MEKNRTLLPLQLFIYKTQKPAGFLILRQAFICLLRRVFMQMDQACLLLFKFSEFFFLSPVKHQQKSCEKKNGADHNRINMHFIDQQTA